MAHIRIDTFGWDTQYIQTFAKMNEAIKRNRVGLVAISQESKYPSGRVLSQISDAQWGDWELTSDLGGGNHLVNLKCQIPRGIYYHFDDTDAGAANPSVRWDISGAACWFQVRMEWVAENAVTITDNNSTGGRQQKLMIATNAIMVNGVSQPAITLLKSNVTDLTSYQALQGLDQITAPGLFENMMRDWINGNVDQFEHVFCQMLVNEVADQGQWQWLKPSTVDYAVAVDPGGSLDKSIISANCMVGHHSPIRNFNQVDQRIVGLMTKSDSVLALSPRMVTENFLLQGCLALQLGSREEDWVFDADGNGISNKDDMKIAQLPAASGFAQAAISKGDMRLSLHDENILLEMNGISWDYDDGHKVSATYKCYYNLVLKSGTDANGNPYKNVMTVEADDNESLAITVNETKTAIQKGIIADIGWGLMGGLIGAGVGAAVEKVVSSVFARFIGRAGADAAGEFSTNATRAGVEMSELVGGTGRVFVDAEGDALEGAALQAAKSAYAKAVTDSMVQAQEETVGKLVQLADVPENLTADTAKNAARIAGLTIRNTGTNLINYVWAQKYKLIGGLAGTFVGGYSAAAVQNAQTQLDDKLAEIPSLSVMMGNIVGGVKWPDQRSGTEGFEIQEVRLEDAMLIGGKIVLKP